MNRSGDNLLLLKGLEEEVYGGTPDGHTVPLSQQVAAELADYATEPDGRNIELRTDPHREYEQVIGELMDRRRRLRRFLEDLGGYTLIPGASLSLGPTDRFFISEPDNPYYQFIRDTYGTNVVTASSHINIGVDDPETLVRAYRLIRCEAPLFLALSAASPFLDGRVTGYHSTRWHLFPKTPTEVPLFEHHNHFIAWIKAKLADGSMQNPRHLWLSVRPNGPASPCELNRLELRVFDRLFDPTHLTAVSALLEGRVWQVIEDPQLDPLIQSNLPAGTRHDDLIALVAANEQAAARSSLEAELRHWQDGRKISAGQWIEQLLEQVEPTAEAHGFDRLLAPIRQLLQEGNPAQRWLRRHGAGDSPQTIIQEDMVTMTQQDFVCRDTVC